MISQQLIETILGIPQQKIKNKKENPCFFRETKLINYAIERFEDETEGEDLFTEWLTENDDSHNCILEIINLIKKNILSDDMQLTRESMKNLSSELLDIENYRTI